MKSNTKIDIIRYPDGQISVVIPQIYSCRDIELTHRFNTYEDLIVIVSICQVAKREGRKVRLTIPCFLGQRSDREFNRYQSFDLKIYCDILNSIDNIEYIKILDPHSDVLPALLDRCIVESPEEYIRSFKRIFLYNEDLVYVSPDAGAYKKCYKLAELHAVPLVASNKVRDEKGNPIIEVNSDVKGKSCLIIDDYLDGGRTFVYLAKRLKELGAKKVYLYVSHALFSAGESHLKEYIDKIFCTNSIKDIESDFVKQHNVMQ